MGSSKKQTVAYKYSLGVHMPFCHGPIDKVTRIRVDNKVAWTGESTGGTISINEPELFGGEDREGGISGDVDFDFGETTQTVNTYLQSKQQSDIPAYRGVAAAILKQVYLGNNPYLKPWEFRAQRIHTSTRGATQWYDEKAEIGTIYYFSSTTQNSYIGSNNLNISGVDCSTGRQVIVKGSGDYTPPDGWSSPTSGPLPDGFVEGYRWLSGFDASTGYFIDPLSAAESAFSGVYASQIDYICNYYKNTDYQYTVFYQTNGTASPPNTCHGPFYVNAFACNIGVDFACSTIEDAYPIEWPSGLPIQLIFNNATGLFETHPYQTDVPIEYSGGISSVNFCDSTTGDPVSISIAYSYADMNPAHIIRECLTDTTWGLGYTAADIDDTSFTAAADTLFNEEFGLSFLWSKEVEIEEFIKDVLRHIDGVLYVSPSTGKFTLKLIRDDYVLASLPVFDESNIIEIQDYKKPTIGELKNYITVKYWDISKSENASISVQDPALALQQGAVISETIQFDGVTSGNLASRLASRALAQLSNPLIICSIIANRSAYNLNIGDAFKLTWPKYGISEVVMRVTNIGFGELTSGAIKIECAQDVFGLPAASFVAPSDSNFTPITNAPTAITNQIARETDYWSIIQDQGESFTLGNLDGYLLTAAGQPTSDSIAYRIWTDESGDYVEKEPADFCPVATLTEDMLKAINGVVVETVSISGLTDIDIEDIDIGSMCQINDELMSVVSVSTSSVTVGRAVADSAIADHVTGDKIYFYGQSFAGNSETLYQDGESLNVKLTPSTGLGQLDVVDATAIPLTFDQRAYRPYPPGNIKLNTVYFPEYLEGVSSVDSTWAHRDRLLQTADLNDFTETSIGPEASTTYTTTLTRVNNSAILDTNSGLTGTSDSLDAMGYDGLVRYQIKSVRSSVDSFFSQTHELPITRTSFIFTEQGDFIQTEDGEYLVTES